MEKYIKRCYELAISSGKKGYDTFGAVLVHDGKILEEAEKIMLGENKLKSLDQRNFALSRLKQ